MIWLAVNKQMLKYMGLKGGEGEGTQPGHNATKSGADTQGAMHSSTDKSDHFVSFHTWKDIFYSFEQLCQ